jgi:hypothetical protein
VPCQPDLMQALKDAVDGRGRPTPGGLEDERVYPLYEIVRALKLRKAAPSTSALPGARSRTSTQQKRPEAVPKEGRDEELPLGDGFQPDDRRQGLRAERCMRPGVEAPAGRTGVAMRSVSMRSECVRKFLRGRLHHRLMGTADVRPLAEEIPAGWDLIGTKERRRRAHGHD